MISNSARPLPKENSKAILKPGIFSKQIIPQAQASSIQKSRSKTPPLHSREFRPKSLISNFNNVSQDELPLGESMINNASIQNPSSIGTYSNLNNNMKELQSNALKREVMKENINTLQHSERNTRSVSNNKPPGPVKPLLEANILRQGSSVFQNPVSNAQNSVAKSLADRADSLGLSQEPVPDPKARAMSSIPDNYCNLESVSPLRKSVTGVSGLGTNRSPFHERSNSLISNSTRRGSIAGKLDEKNRLVAEEPPQSPYRAPLKIAAAPARRSEPGSPFTKKGGNEGKRMPTPDRGCYRDDQMGKNDEGCYKEKLTENIIESMLNKERNEEILRNEKKNLQDQVKRLIGEVQELKYKSSIYESENKELKEALQRERSHYQSELLKISEKIRKLKNIQALYLKEKESSERIENQLITKEKLANDYRTKLLKVLQDLIEILKSRSNPFENLCSDRGDNEHDGAQGHIMYCIFSIVNSMESVIAELNLEKEFQLLKESFNKNDSVEESRPLQKNFLAVRSSSSLLESGRANGNPSAFRLLSSERQSNAIQSNPKAAASKPNEQASKAPQSLPHAISSSGKTDYKPLFARLPGNNSESQKEINHSRRNSESIPLVPGKNNPLLSNDSFAEKEKLWQGSGEHADGELRNDELEDEANNLENFSGDKNLMGSEFLLQNELSETFQVLEEKIHQINIQMKNSAAVHQESCRRIEDHNYDQELSRNKRDKSLGNMKSSGASNYSKEGEVLEGFRLRIEEEKRKRAEEARSNNDTGEISLDSQKLNPGEIKASITSQLERLMNGMQESQKSLNANQGALNPKHARQGSSQSQSSNNFAKKLTAEPNERHYSNISDLIQKPLEDRKKDEQLLVRNVQSKDSEPKSLNELRQRQTSVESKRTNPPESSKKTYANESFGGGDSKAGNFAQQQFNLLQGPSDPRSKPNTNSRKNAEIENESCSVSEDKSDKAEYAVAKFDFAAQKENDLSFSRGDRIQVLKKTKNGWWIGLFKNKIGYFPYNFVETS